jgi:RNA polymerase sigma-70 factor (ECF subfamily)
MMIAIAPKKDAKSSPRATNQELEHFQAKRQSNAGPDGLSAPGTHIAHAEKQMQPRLPLEAARFDVVDAADQVGAQLVAFLPNLRRFAIALSRSRDIGDELVQMACERALANAAHFEPGTRFDAWMFRILRNLWIDHIRKQRRTARHEDIDQRQDISGTSGLRDAEARLTLTSVARAIGDLPDDQREVLLLTCVEDLSYREAAEVLGIPIGTVMSRLARARKKLAEAAGLA